MDSALRKTCRVSKSAASHGGLRVALSFSKAMKTKTIKARLRSASIPSSPVTCCWSATYPPEHIRCYFFGPDKIVIFCEI
jgi:hypothetical protein